MAKFCWRFSTIRSYALCLLPDINSLTAIASTLQSRNRCVIKLSTNRSFSLSNVFTIHLLTIRFKTWTRFLQARWRAHIHWPLKRRHCQTKIVNILVALLIASITVDSLSPPIETSKYHVALKNKIILPQVSNWNLQPWYFRIWG